MRVQGIYRKRPKLIIPTVAVGGFLLFSLFECVRARLYLANIEAYTHSTSVLNLVGAAENLLHADDKQSGSLFCQFSLSEISDNTDIAYEAYQRAIAEVSKPPVYSSIMRFLPKPKKARQTSVEFAGAYTRLQQLAETDIRSKYCAELSDALRNLDFMTDLQKPESVSALLPGQLENYQIQVAKAREVLQGMSFPSDFSSEHADLFRTIDQVGVHLRGDDNKYTTFARVIEGGLDSITEILVRIQEKSLDLQLRPVEISLQAHYFEAR